MAQDRRADARDREFERAAAGGREQQPRGDRATAAALLNEWRGGTGVPDPQWAYKNGLREGGRSIWFERTIDRLAVAVDDDRPAIAIEVAIMIAAPLDHDSLVAIPVLALADHFPIAIAIVARSDGYASRADTNADLFRAGRHCKGN